MNEIGYEAVRLSNQIIFVDLIPRLGPVIVLMTIVFLGLVIWETNKRRKYLKQLRKERIVG